MRCTSWSLKAEGKGWYLRRFQPWGASAFGDPAVGRVPGRSRSGWFLCLYSPFLAVLGGGSVLSAPLLSRFVSVATSRVPRAIFPTCLGVWCNVMQPGGQTDALCLVHVYKIVQELPVPLLMFFKNCAYTGVMA